MKRACLDANVILRFLTGDPPEMAEKARLLFGKLNHGELILVVPEIIVAEVVWVLASYYGYSASQIAAVLGEFLSHEAMEIEDPVKLHTALTLYADMNIDFGDALVAAQMALHGPKEVYSFDTHFDKLSGITRLVP